MTILLFGPPEFDQKEWNKCIVRLEATRVLLQRRYQSSKGRLHEVAAIIDPKFALWSFDEIRIFSDINVEALFEELSYWWKRGKINGVTAQMAGVGGLVIVQIPRTKFRMVKWLVKLSVLKTFGIHKHP